jgi:Holliday junction resolvase-like predicted endonuclease
VLLRTADYFLCERPFHECPPRFDVVAIENTAGHHQLPAFTKLHSAQKSLAVSASAFIKDAPLTSIERREEYNTWFGWAVALH